MGHGFSVPAEEYYGSQALELNLYSGSSSARLVTLATYSAPLSLSFYISLYFCECARLFSASGFDTLFL
jgi:hypothetical protein